MADPSNVFKATLAVQYLDLGLKLNKDWYLNASVKASFSGIPLEKHFSDLQALITVTSRSAILTINKNLLDVSVDMPLAGIDCNLNVKFSDPKIVFATPKEPQLEIALDVTGFDALNKLFPFKVFKNRLVIEVVITKEKGLMIKLRTIPIEDKLIPCVENEEEYTCDFTWLCQEDSFVKVKLPSLAYTRDGFSGTVDVQGIERLCIPLMLRFMRQFFQNIPLISELFKKNIPLWPPPDIIDSLYRIGCNIDNLPRGMERFRNPKFPKEITLALTIAENGPLRFSLEVQNGESVNVIMPITLPIYLMGISLSRFSIGSAFGVPFVDISTEVYLWDLVQVVLLSKLPKHPLLINVEEMETRIICKDCFFIIVGVYPVPIFAAPLSIKHATLIGLQAQATIYHRRPDFGDFSEFGTLLVGLLKFFTDVNYLLSFDDFKNSSLLVVKLSHGNEKTMVQLPAFNGGKKLILNVPPIDGKRFLIGFMNYWKTFELKWLLQTVPLRYRILNIAFNIGPFQWHLLKFAASTPTELSQNRDIWPYEVKETGDDALIIASADLLLLSTDVTLRIKSYGNAGLSFRLNAVIKKLVKISITASTRIQLGDSSNPVMIYGNAQVKLFDDPLLSGRAKVSGTTISLSGELKFNFHNILAFSGKVEAEVHSPSQVFALDANADVHLLGVQLSKAHLYINISPARSVIKSTATFMGSHLNIALITNGFSFNVQAQASIRIPLEVDLGKISIAGTDIGRIVLSAGFACDLKISFPGRSSMAVSFYFMGIKLKLSLKFYTRDVTLDRIPSLLVDLIKNEAPNLIKDLLWRNPREMLKALINGFLDFAGDVGELFKDLLKIGLKFSLKELGKFLNNLVDVTKAISETAERLGKAAEKAAKATRELASKAVEAASKAFQQAGKSAQEAGKKLAEAGKAFAQAVGRTIRLDNAVREAKRVFKNISRALEDVVNRIGEIVLKIADEIARGIRNLAGTVIKGIGIFRTRIGKRLIYRRDALSEEKGGKEREKAKLQKHQSNQRARIRYKERELSRAQKEEQLKRNLRDNAQKEASRSSDNLKRAYKEKTQKMAVVEDIINKGKCVTGENNCHPNATCLRWGPEGQSFRCVCRHGWIGNGTFCARPIKGVAIISDSPKAVGEDVSFATIRNKCPVQIQF